MLANVAIGISVIAMLSWGLGDFLIQKSSRRLGDWETLFVITFFGTIILLPFSYRELPAILGNTRDLSILLGSAVLLTAAAIFEIESFRRGKMSVVEPMLPFEIPTAAVLAAVILGDQMSALQIALIVFLIIGLFLVSFRGRIFSLRYFAEKGIFLGLIGAAIMGVADFFLGWGSCATDPIVANLVLNIVMAAVSFLVLVATGRIKRVIPDVSKNRGLALAMSIADNIGWVGYAFAMAVIPIGVATGLSETSCIIAVCLGLFMNKEKLQSHQKTGLFVALLSAIVLAFVTA
ncbi:MAG: DMT family transporter [Patescibacteria group bacterium]|nr:DMT family transporter [Patescibacteria group bacterium]